MPQYQDCTFDQLIEDYAELQANRLHEDPDSAYQFIYETLSAQYERMTERELIDHINEVECEDTADEIISTHYGINPPDCFITGWQLRKCPKHPTQGAFFVYNKNVHTKEHTWNVLN